MVVDDDAAIRELLETILVADGYRVFAEADGDAALARVKREQPDLVLLDVMLGAQDGLDLLAQLRRTSDVPVIFLTARYLVKMEMWGLRDIAMDSFAR